MRKNVKLLSTISIAAALAGGTITALNNNVETAANSTVEAASITLPSGYTLLVILRVPLLNGTKLVEQARL